MNLAPAEPGVSVLARPAPHGIGQKALFCRAQVRWYNERVVLDGKSNGQVGGRAGGCVCVEGREDEGA